MATTFHLRVWTRFFAPLEDVWALKTDPAAIQAELQPWSSFSIKDGDALRRADLVVGARLQRWVPRGTTLAGRMLG